MSITPGVRGGACRRFFADEGFLGSASIQIGDPSTCQPSERVNALQIFGTADSGYAGDGDLRVGAEQSQIIWAERNGCNGISLGATGESRDYDRNIAGDETDVLTVSGCPEGGAVELWKINDGPHLPFFTETWQRNLVEWLLAHPKP